MRDILVLGMLQLVAGAIIIAEFVIPSGGLLSLAALGFLGYAFFYAWQTFAVTGLMWMTLGTALLLPVTILIGVKLLVRSAVTLHKKIDSPFAANPAQTRQTNLIGEVGEVITDLRPSGKIRVGTGRFDVVTTGDYIEKGAQVVITAIDGNRIVVKKNQSPD